MNAPFMRLASQTVTVKRPPEMTGTPPRRGAPQTVYAESSCTPFYPVSADVAARMPLEPAHELFECFTLDEWREGDTITDAGGNDYAVISVADWPWNAGQTTRQAVLRQAKR